MNPYLERHWPGVQLQLVVYCANVLNMQLPEDLVARIDERTAIEPPVEPQRLAANRDPLTERFVKVISAESDQTITRIEFLSPTNKQDEGLRAYKAMRNEVLEAGANIVEIDLVRAGDWRLLFPFSPPSVEVTAYRAIIHFGSPRTEAWVYPVPLRERLPSIPVPLRSRENESVIDLQPLVERVYSAGRYARTLNYRKPCDPPLSVEDVAWLEQRLRDPDQWT